MWLGTTVEDQASAETLLPHLSKMPAAVRFISAEPLRGALEIQPWLRTTIDWVITGGESGPKARPSSPSWFRELLSQCAAASAPFHFKQWGDWAPGACARRDARCPFTRGFATSTEARTQTPTVERQIIQRIEQK